MSQDRDGYIWLATDNGVCRFDGFSFKYFTQAEGLTDNEFFLIKQDSKGRIWLLPSNGIPCFIENGKVHNPTNTPFLRKIVGNSWFTGFGQDGEGNVWLSMYLFRIFKVNRNNEVVQFDLPPIAKLPSDISIDFEGKAWVLNGIHSYCLSKNPKFPHPDFISFREKIVKPFILKNRDIIGSGDSSLYFCSNSEKRLLRAEGERIKSEIIKVSQINDSTVLLVNFEGVFIYDIKSSKYKRLIS